MIFFPRHHRQGRGILRRAIVVALIAAMLLPVASSIDTAHAAAGIYKPISYQGKVSLTNGTAVANGKYNMRFKIYDSLSAGSLLWTETWNSGNQVTMTGGLFTVRLGSITTMAGSVDFNSDSLYLQVEFDPANAGTYPEVFSPRRQFTSVPYALNADQLDGLDSTQFVRSDTFATASGITVRPHDTTQNGVNIVSIAGLAATAALKLSTQGANHIVFGTGGANYDTNLYRQAAARLRTDSSFWVGGTLSGAALTVMNGNSSFLGNLGIGTTSAETALEVIGTASGRILHAQDTLSSSGMLVIKGVSTFQNNIAVRGNLSGAVLNIMAGNSYLLGNVSLGTSTAASTALEIIGMGSGRMLRATDALSSSGTLSVAGTSLFGNNINVRGTISGSTLTLSNLTSGSVPFFGANGAITQNNSNFFWDAFAGGLAIGKTNARTKLDVNGTISGSTLSIMNSAASYILGNVGIGTSTAASTALEIIGMGSGRMLRATDALSSSGSLAVAGMSLFSGPAIFSSTVKLNGVTYTWPSTDGAASGRVLATNSAGQLSWTAGGGGSMSIGGSVTSGTQGSVLFINSGNLAQNNANFFWDVTNVGLGIGKANAKTKLDVAGTISGTTLTVMGGNSYFLGNVSLGTSTAASTALEVIGTASGRILQATDTLTSSGTLVVSGASTFKSTMKINGVTYTFPSSDGAASGRVLATNSAGQLSWTAAATGGGTMIIGGTVTGGGNKSILYLDGSHNLAQDPTNLSWDYTNHRLGVGTTTPESALEVIGTASGRILQATDTLTSSGTLVVKGATTLKSTVKINGVTYTFPSTDGAASGRLLATNSAGQLSWTPGIMAIGEKITGVGGGDVLYANGAGNLTVNSNFVWDYTNNRLGIGMNSPKTHLSVLGTISGSTIRADSSLISNNTLTVAGLTTLNGYFQDNGAANITSTLDVGALTSLNGNLLENANADIEGALNVDGATTLYTTTVTGQAEFTSALYADSSVCFNAYCNTWPSSNGSNGQVLTTNGAGTLSWAGSLTAGTSAISNGGDKNILFQNGSVLAEDSNLQWDNSNGGTLGTTHFDASSDATFHGNVSIDGIGANCNNTNQAVRSNSYNVLYCGDVTTNGSDYAENYPTLDVTLGSGELLSIDPLHPNFVKRASGSGSERLLGIVSTKAGFILKGNPLDYPGAHQVPVALNGRVPLRVTGEAGPIAIGDGLARSSVSGMARKAKGNDTTIGYALEAFTGSTIADHGYVKVFVHQQDAPVVVLSGSSVHASDMLSSSGSLKVVGSATFGSDVTIKSSATSSGTSIFTIISNVHGSNDPVMRVTAGGDVSADGAFTGGGADYAEWFKTTSPDLTFGEAVCIDVTQPNTVRRCTTSGDPDIIGLVSSSSQAAFIGNKFSGAAGLPVPGTTLVGLLGQLSGNLVVESGAVIRPGDPLAAGTLPGTLRKAAPGESTVGVALEGLESGSGIRKVLISRKNQSLTAEAVSARVLETVKNLNIEQDLQSALQDSMNKLSSTGAFIKPIQAEVQRQIDSLHVTDLQGQIDALVKKVAALEASTGSLVGYSSSGGIKTGGTLTASAISIEYTLIVGKDARVAGDLYLDGMLKVQDLFVPGSLKVDGDLQAGALKSDTLSVGAATVNDGLTVMGTTTLNGNVIIGSGATLTADALIAKQSLQVLGSVTIRGFATFFGDVQVRGTLSLSSNQTGSATVAAGGTGVTVPFPTPFQETPAIEVTPHGLPSAFWGVTNESATGFTIQLTAPAAKSLTFSWLAIPVVNETGTSISSPSVAHDESLNAPATLSGQVLILSSVSSDIPFPVDEHRVPLSSDPIWNNCIRNVPTFDADGKPYNCGRYHVEHTWTQPDSHIEFDWNTLVTPPVLTLPDGYKAVTQQTPAPAVSTGAQLPVGTTTTATGATTPAVTTGSTIPSTSSGTQVPDSTTPPVQSSGSGLKSVGALPPTDSGTGTSAH